MREDKDRSGKWLLVVELWNVPAAELLSANDVGLIPWVPLAAFAGPPEDLLRQCWERIDQQAKPEERANLLAVSQVLTALRYDDAQAVAFFGGHKTMIESPLLERMMAARMHKAIMKALAKRFGSVPAAIEQQLQKVQDDDRLDLLVIQAWECQDLAAFSALL